MSVHKLFNKKYLVVAIASVFMPLSSYTLAQEVDAQKNKEAQDKVKEYKNDEVVGEFSLEKITVTARRREENLQRTPIAMTAVSGDEIEQRGLSDITGITKFTPNVTLEGTAPLSGSSAAAFAFIRGVGQTDFSQGSEPGVGIYVDGVYLGRSVGQVMSTVDLERLEVLRGPQGTLFGRNTIGGAISLTSVKPIEDFEAKIEATLGEFNRRDLKTMINLPLNDELAVRLNLSTFNRDGYVIRQPDGLDLGDQNKISGRLAFRWTPSDDLTVDWAFDAQRDRENGAPATLIAVNTQPVGGQPGGTPEGAPPNFPAVANCFAQGLPPVSPPCTNFNGVVGNSIFYNEQFLPPNPFTTFGSGPFAGLGESDVPTDYHSDLDLWGTNLTITLDVGFGEFKSITAFRDLDSSFARDDDHSPVLISGTSNLYKQQQFSQELQFNGEAFNDTLKYTFGVYYFEEEGSDANQVITPVSHFLSGGSIENENLAAFAQATYSATEKLSITAGVRYTKEEKNYTPDQRYLTNLAGFPGINVDGQFGIGEEFNLIQPLGERKVDFNETTPLLNIAYQITDNVMAYATYSAGFKSGGFSQRIFPAQPLVPDFRPEFVDVYEVGIKSELFDKRVRFNASAFYTDYEDIQVTVQEGFAPQTANAAEATINGFEIEITALPMEDLEISIGLGYLENEYKTLGDTVIGLTKDSVFPYTPEFKASISAEYTFVTETGFIRPRIDFSYTDDFYTDALNTPQIQQEAYELINASVAWDLDDYNLKVVAGVTNLTDKVYFPVASQDLAVKGSAEANYARPREAFLKVSYYFY